MIWIWVVAILLGVIGVWELLALVTKQKRMPTWSRLIRAIGSGRPEWKPWIVVVTLTVGFTISIWAAIHLVTPEGWLWDEFLFLLEDLCVTIGLPC